MLMVCNLCYKIGVSLLPIWTCPVKQFFCKSWLPKPKIDCPRQHNCHSLKLACICACVHGLIWTLLWLIICQSWIVNSSVVYFIIYLFSGDSSHMQLVLLNHWLLHASYTFGLTFSGPIPIHVGSPHCSIFVQTTKKSAKSTPSILCWIQ